MYDIVYKPRTTLKAQALSDYMAECIETRAPLKERELDYWTINFDRSLQLQGAGAEILVTSPKGESLCHDRFLCQNQVLIVCVYRDQIYTHIVQKIDTE
jgi:hypothetical protein